MRDAPEKSTLFENSSPSGLQAPFASAVARRMSPLLLTEQRYFLVLHQSSVRCCGLWWRWQFTFVALKVKFKRGVAIDNPAGRFGVLVEKDLSDKCAFQRARRRQDGVPSVLNAPGW